MRILVLSEVFPPQNGGSGRWLWELYRRLEGLDLQVVAGRSEGAESFDAASTLRTMRVPLHFSNWGLLDPRGAAHYARVWLPLSREISRTRPDILHCGKCLPEGVLGLLVKRWRGIPFCCYAHGEELTLARTSWELQRLATRVMRHASLVIANSEHTQQLLLKDWGVDPDKITVVHPGVDTTQYVPAPKDPALLARLGWTDRQVVLTVGALRERKGQDMLIRALPQIRSQCPRVLYALAGEGPDRSRLEDLVRSVNVADSVRFLGSPHDVELLQCYQQCDVFALPNRQVGWDFEGFGMVLLEAQACGKPVIAGVSGGTAEAMEPGRTGLRIPCEGPGELAKAVSSLLNDDQERAQLGARARIWAVEHFDWNVVTRPVQRLFAEPARNPVATAHRSRPKRLPAG